MQNIKLTWFSRMKERVHSFGKTQTHGKTIYFAFPVTQELKDSFSFGVFFLSFATDYNNIIISFYDGLSSFSP